MAVSSTLSAALIPCSTPPCVGVYCTVCCNQHFSSCATQLKRHELKQQQIAVPCIPRGSLQVRCRDLIVDAVLQISACILD